MARQTGVITLKGTVGGISFYKSRDGHMAREKGGVDGNRIKNDPAFVRTRENGAEFGRAGKASKLLRTAIRTILQNAKDRRVTSRLTTDMLKVIQMDATNPRGMRNVIDGEAELLQDFEFNANSSLTSTLYAPYTPTINRVAGMAEITLAPFIPANVIAAPAGATHYQLVSAGAEIDFENEVYVVSQSDSGQQPLDTVATAPMTLSNNFTANSTHVLFLLLGVLFFQDVNGVKYPLKNGAFNSLAIVGVSGV
jgi:hypothetical protein